MIRKVLTLLDVTDFYRCSDPKTWIEGLLEGGLKPVQEGHGAAYAVKGQYTCHVVQVHAYPGGVGAVDCFVHSVVPGRVTWVGAEKTPGFVVVTQKTEWAFALSAEAFVGHPDGEFAAPLDFPVEAASG